MSETPLRRIDLIEEFSLRRWARENHVPPESRNPAWHPVVLEEMDSKDQEHPSLDF